MKLTRRERWLLRKATSLLNEAFLNEAHPIRGNQDYSGKSADELAAALQEVMATKGLKETVAFLNDAMITANAAMKEVLTGDAFVGNGDGPWSFDGSIDQKQKDGRTVYEIKGNDGTPAKVKTYFPTQGTIDMQKSVGWVCSAPASIKWANENIADIRAGYSDFRKEPVACISVDENTNYILDGHHRWSAMACYQGAEGVLKGAGLSIPGQSGGSGDSAEEFLKLSQVGIAGDVLDQQPDKSTEGLPYARGKGDAESDASGADWTGGPCEMLKPKLEWTGWAQLFDNQVVSHDSKQILGSPVWFKALATSDPNGSFPWLKGMDQFTSSAEFSSAYPKITAWANGGAIEDFTEEKPQKPEGYLHDSLPNRTEEMISYDNAKSEYEDRARAHAAEQNSREVPADVKEAMKVIWSMMGKCFEANWNECHKEPPTWAEAREPMPQYGGDKASYKTKGGMGGVLDRAKQDPKNYGKEYTRQGGAPQTSNPEEQPPEDELENQGVTDGYVRPGGLMNEAIDISRWSKLAGITKK